jgi:hypothetical protein
MVKSVPSAQAKDDSDLLLIAPTSGTTISNALVVYCFFLFKTTFLESLNRMFLSYFRRPFLHPILRH